jgi:hypothetical protein
VWLDVDASWWNHSIPGAIQPRAHCDQGCQAYVLAELLDGETGAAIAGYEKEKCILRNVEGSRLPLRWVTGDAGARGDTGTKRGVRGGAAGAAQHPQEGQAVRLRLYFRAATVYAFGTG